VGDVCLQFFDTNGRPALTDLSSRVLGISAPQLRSIERRIGVAGGVRKHEAIRAAVRGGWINILITDVDTARALAED
jgi:DNA-binding transcriptional regulator LsrR (DeoR family)